MHDLSDLPDITPLTYSEHRARAARLRGDLDTAQGGRTWASKAPAIASASAALATAHETAALNLIVTEMKGLLEAIAGPAAVQAAEEAAINAPDHVDVPVLQFPTRPDSKDRRS